MKKKIILIVVIFIIFVITSYLIYSKISNKNDDNVILENSEEIDTEEVSNTFEEADENIEIENLSEPQVETTNTTSSLNNTIEKTSTTATANSNKSTSSLGNNSTTVSNKTTSQSGTSQSVKSETQVSTANATSNKPVEEKKAENVSTYKTNNELINQMRNYINQNVTEDMKTYGYQVIVDSSIVSQTNYFTYTDKRMASKIQYLFGTIRIYARDLYVNGEYAHSECFIY